MATPYPVRIAWSVPTLSHSLRFTLIALATLQSRNPPFTRYVPLSDLVRLTRNVLSSSDLRRHIRMAIAFEVVEESVRGNSYRIREVIGPRGRSAIRLFAID